MFEKQPIARFLAPVRQHERMNIESVDNVLDLESRSRGRHLAGPPLAASGLPRLAHHLEHVVQEFFKPPLVVPPRHPPGSLPVAPGGCVYSELPGRLPNGPASRPAGCEHALLERSWPWEGVMPQPQQYGRYGADWRRRATLFPVQDRPIVDP